MELIIRNTTNQPIYEQISSQIKAQIIAGKLSPGEALPSIRALAKDLRISVITTKRAYEELEREGFLTTVPGKGCFVAARDLELVREETLRRVEEHLSQAVDLAKGGGVTLEELEELNPEGIILSPGPKRPWDAKLCVDTVKRFQGRIPVLGVCLGHQVIGHCAGAVVEKGVCPMHGKVTEIHNHGTGVFAGLPEKYKVTRYHSLIVREDSIPEEYQVDALSDDGAVMGISHKALPIYGVQFHPEAVLTEYGHELLENFCRIAENFQKEE